jgi:hypothetical protein
MVNQRPAAFLPGKICPHTVRTQNLKGSPMVSPATLSNSKPLSPTAVFFDEHARSVQNKNAPENASSTEPSAASAGFSQHDAQQGANTLQALAKQGTPQQVKARPSLKEIKRKYQTQEEPLVDWEPKLAGVIPVHQGKRQITPIEAKMLDKLAVTHGVVGLHTFNAIKDKAFAAADKHYPPSTAPLPKHVQRDIQKLPLDDQKLPTENWPRNDGHNDAFRHAYWSAQLTKQYGAEWARQFTTAHEGAPGNSAVREAMDLHNNEVGRKIAEANPNATPEQLATMIAQAAKEGKLVVVDAKGQLAWSDKVVVNQHGLANPTMAPGGAPVPPGDASAKERAMSE